MTLSNRASLLIASLLLASGVSDVALPAERSAKKPDPEKLTKNQAKAARRAARARKGGH